MFDKRNWLAQHADHIRLRMLREPRGYPAANCNLILPSNHPEADAGFVIMEQVEYPPMSGTNTICVVTVLIETGMVKAVEPVTHLKLETPAGLIAVDAEVHHGKVRKVTFRNVPAFATHLDAKVEVRGLGTVTVDVAYGGMFYVIADAVPLGLTLAPDRRPRHRPDRGDDQGRDAGTTARGASGESRHRRSHHRAAFGAALASWTRTARTPWWSPPARSIGRGRKPGPACSTARRAAPAPAPRWRRMHAKGQLGLYEDFVHEGILGTTFTGRLLEETRVGPYAAVVPSLSGQAWITGFAQYVVDPEDPFPNGFTVGDIWGKA